MAQKGLTVTTDSFVPFFSNRRRTLQMAAAWVLAARAGIGSAQSPAGEDAALRAAVDGPQRSDAFRARDGARHPYETLRFFGIAPQLSVVEIAPGGGWYTEILAPYLRERGRFYAAHDAADDPKAERRKARAAFDAKLKQKPDVYGRVMMVSLPDSRHGFNGLNVPGGADMVLTFRNIHNWIEGGYLDEMLRAFAGALKTGGVLGVEEHRAPPGTPIDRVIQTGYVPEQLVIDRAEAAGFKLVARSEVNANPRDTKDHANGVWSLPPTLRGSTADRDKYLAIGESDRMTLKFAKR
jgi:predicted methyltransferase